MKRYDFFTLPVVLHWRHLFLMSWCISSSLFSGWRCVYLCYSNQRFLMKAKIGAQPSRKSIQPGVNVHSNRLGQGCRCVLWMGDWRKTRKGKTLTLPRLTSSAGKTGVWKSITCRLKTISRSELLSYSLLFGISLIQVFSLSQWVLSFLILVDFKSKARTWNSRRHI